MKGRSMEKGGFFPIFLDLRDKVVVFVGAGRIATRRVKAMEGFAGRIVVVAPEATDEIAGLAEEGSIEWRRQEFSPDALEGAALVLACTGDHGLNDEIYALCRERGILANACSDHTKCDFHYPGVVRKGNFTVGVNASGKDHAAARELRERIEALLDEME